MERPKVGVGVFVIKENKILLGKRKNSHGDGTWSLPGGHLEAGESFENCAKREVLEETGLIVDNLSFLYVTNDIFQKEDKHYITIFMKCNISDGIPKVMEPDKCEEWRWFFSNELPRPLFLPIENLLNKNIDPINGISVYDVIKNRRSIRSYKTDKIAEEILLKCVDSGRMAPTGRNAQPLEFIIITKNLEDIFKCAGFAGSVEWKPKVSEMPQAYIAIISKKETKAWNLSMDVGIAAENIVLCAESFGVSSCMLGALNKIKLSEILKIPEEYEIHLLLSLGHKNHDSISYDSEIDQKYSCDASGNFRIPKIPLNKVMHKNYF